MHKEGLVTSVFIPPFSSESASGKTQGVNERKDPGLQKLSADLLSQPNQDFTIGQPSQCTPKH